MGAVRHRWRDYRTSTGRRPVKEFLDDLSDSDAAEITAAMREVAHRGLRAARHLRREIFEVRAEGADHSFRLLFSAEGRKGRVLLALVPLSKQTRRTPPRFIALAERRLADWRRRGPGSLGT